MNKTASINRRTVEVNGERSILEAVRAAGGDVPTLCHVDGLDPEAGCRVCVVEVDGALIGACHTPLRPGMKVVTDSANLRQHRRQILSWLSRRANARIDPSTHFGRMLHEYGVEQPQQREPGAARVKSTYLRFDPDRCIRCRVCVNVCEQLQGQFVYGISERGAESRLIIGADDDFESSECTSCGACVAECPTGALYDVHTTPGKDLALTPSTCGYCGVGCGINVRSDHGRVLRIEGSPRHPVNRGHLCAKGRYALGWQTHPDRLTKPQLREGGRLRSVSWDTATNWLAEKLADIAKRHGPDALAAIASSRSTNEAGYLLGKLFRAVVGTNNIDCCARVCHSSTALALSMVTGTGAASASYQDIEEARLIFLAGANPTEAHPIVGARIKQAVLRGARLIVVDPRRIELTQYADIHLALAPGTNVALFNALAALLLEKQWIDKDYLASRCEGLGALREHLGKQSPQELAGVSGVDLRTLIDAAQLLGAGPALFVHGLGLSELTSGTASVMALCNLGMLTGSIGRGGAGMLPLRGQNNVQGQADMGAMPDRVTGYQPLTANETKKRCVDIWGCEPPPQPGLTSTLMLRAARKGSLKGLWIQGEDVMQSEPEPAVTREALEKLELLVVQDLFPCETTPWAHLILPAAGYLEQDGTFTNGERRIQRVRPAVPAPGEARPDWQVVAEVARKMGAPWNYASPGEVFDEIAALAPHLFGGVSYSRLERVSQKPCGTRAAQGRANLHRSKPLKARDRETALFRSRAVASPRMDFCDSLLESGLQWPCPDRNHPGTATVHESGFLRGKGQLSCLDSEPNPEGDVEGFPLTLITGRVLQHYNVGTMTRRTPSVDLVARDHLDLCPADAAAHQITAGMEVIITSRWGSTRAIARVSPTIVSGTAFLSFHFPETRTNALVGPHLDPLSRCPQYKATAVRIQADP